MPLTPRTFDCPDCGCAQITVHKSYAIKEGTVRQLAYCPDCQGWFSETKNTPLEDLKTPLSRITLILDSLNEGQGIKAVCRVFHVGKNSIYRWPERLSALKPTLLLYALCQQFLQQLIEGDEVYTKVKKTFLLTSVRAGRSCSWIELRVFWGSGAVVAKSANCSAAPCVC